METVKAWKDEGYRDTLTLEQMERLPQHPSGLIELRQGELEASKSFATPDVVARRVSYPADCSFYGCCKGHYSL
jgi:mersacidin/lichenicidin family type 2 lantibiotic